MPVAFEFVFLFIREVQQETLCGKQNGNEYAGVIQNQVCFVRLISGGRTTGETRHDIKRHCNAISGIILGKKRDPLVCDSNTYYGQ